MALSRKRQSATLYGSPPVEDNLRWIRERLDADMVTVTLDATNPYTDWTIAATRNGVTRRLATSKVMQPRIAPPDLGRWVDVARRSLEACEATVLAVSVFDALPEVE